MPILMMLLLIIQASASHRQRGRLSSMGLKAFTFEVNVPYLSLAARTKHHRLGALNSRCLFTHSCRGRQSKVKLQQFVPDEDFFLA